MNNSERDKSIAHNFTVKLFIIYHLKIPIKEGVVAAEGLNKNACVDK
jgi:hypothetical protein